MSGGQQNKDEEIVKMVARMNDLKEKQDGQNEDPQICLLKMRQTGDCAYRNGKERCAVDDEFAGFYIPFFNSKFRGYPVIQGKNVSGDPGSGFSGPMTPSGAFLGPFSTEYA